MSDQALARVEPMQPVAVRDQVDINALYRIAVEKGKEGVETVRELMALRREMQAEQAKGEFLRALAAFQRECPPIQKGKAVHNDSGTQLYRYAPFETILRTVKPCMETHGLSFTLDTDTESKDGWVIATCKITHASGHSEVSRGKFPLGGGTRAMSTTQIYAAALSFASRRVFCNALGIVTEGEDHDGAAAGEKQRGPGRAPEPSPSVATPPPPADKVKELKSKLWAMLKTVRGEAKTWGVAEAWLRDHKIIGEMELISSLTAEQLVFVIEKADLTFNPPA